MSHKIIQTGDGTVSLYSDEYSEAMHSVSGAFEESLLKHVYPSNILQYDKKSIHVLDIGFGLGYNCCALLQKFLESGSGQYLTVTAFEKDLSYFPMLKDITFNDERDEIYQIIKELSQSRSITAADYSLTLIEGDARTGIQDIKNNSVDAVFHDPFSPAKNPELWSVDFFREEKRVLIDPGIITTYSSAPQIRVALFETGFKVGIGPSVGGKREGTLATVSGTVPVIREEGRKALYHNPRSVPYRDKELCDTREVIMQRRYREIQLKKKLK